MTSVWQGLPCNAVPMNSSASFVIVCTLAAVAEQLRPVPKVPRQARGGEERAICGSDQNHSSWCVLRLRLTWHGSTQEPATA